MDIGYYLQPTDVHEEQKETSPAHLGFLLLAIAVTLFHTLNLYLLFWKGGSLAVFVLLHMALTSVAGIYAYIAYQREEDSRFGLLLLIAGLCMGAFGTLGVVLSWLMTWFYRRYAMTFRLWFVSIFPRIAPTLPEATYTGIVSGRDESDKPYSVIPFMDVMIVGTETQKREALSKMTSRFDPRFAPAIKRALSDPSNAIRVQAATSMARIENQYLARSMEIEHVLRAQPNEPDVLIAVARHYDDYAFTGLLDEEFERANRDRALAMYERYYRLQPDNAEARLQIGRLLVRSGRLQEARDWFRQTVKDGKQTPAMMSWYLESLYRLKAFDELRQTASHCMGEWKENMPFSSALSDAIRMWAEPGKVAEIRL